MVHTRLCTLRVCGPRPRGGRASAWQYAPCAPAPPHAWAQMPALPSTQSPNPLPPAQTAARQQLHLLLDEVVEDGVVLLERLVLRDEVGHGAAQAGPVLVVWSGLVCAGV